MIPSETLSLESLRQGLVRQAKCIRQSLKAASFVPQDDLVPKGRVPPARGARGRPYTRVIPLKIISGKLPWFSDLNQFSGKKSKSEIL